MKLECLDRKDVNIPDPDSRDVKGETIEKPSCFPAAWYESRIFSQSECLFAKVQATDS